MNSLVVLTLLAAAALVGAVCYTFGLMSTEANSSAAQMEKEKLRQEIMQLQIAPAPLPVAPEPTPEPEIDQTAQDVELLKDKIAALEAEQAYQEQQARVQQQVSEPAIVPEEPEPIVIPEIDPDTEQRLKRRARQVANAMLIAQIDTYTPADGFAIINVINYNNVVEGVKLAIRRNTGIVGQLEVTRVEGGQAVANVLAHTFLAGEVDIAQGDELILPPM